MNNNSIKTVLFDLDGTLADTAPDLAYALNQVLQVQGKPALPLEEIRPVASNGAQALIELGFGNKPQAVLEPLRQQLIEVYRANIARETTLFPGMQELLDNLETQGLNWGVVTNKPRRLTEPLLEALHLARRAACVVSGDTLTERKPHPAPLLLACQQSGCSVAECIYVGDAARDIEAGKRAGMQTLVALFGYIADTDQPDHWQADGMIESPAEILDWLNRNR